MSGGILYRELTWAEAMQQQALKEIPADRILLQDQSTSTIGDAFCVGFLLKKYQFKQAMLITSSWHSRRAYLIFEELIPDMKWISCPVRYQFPKYWWADEVSLSIVTLDSMAICNIFIISPPSNPNTDVPSIVWFSGLTKTFSVPKDSLISKALAMEDMFIW